MVACSGVKGITPMKTTIITALLSAGTLVTLSPMAHAALSPVAAAPAPLLAAGIPAFLAVGGAALISRLRNRKK
jgi:hypothetical protein